METQNMAELQPNRMAFRHGVILKREMIAQNMLLLRIRSEDCREQAWQPGSHIGVFPIEHDKLHRHYTFWQIDPEAGEFDLLILLHHGDGPGVAWAQAAQVGDEITYRGPKSTYTIDPEAPYYLFAAEETGAVAVQAQIGLLPSEMRIFGALESDFPEGEIPTPAGVRPLPWVHRRGEPISETGALVQAIRKLDLPEEPGKAYLAGEAGQCLAIRSYLINERGWPRENVHVQPFWIQGKMSKAEVRELLER
ncbi:siderophore-interacting protein [Thermosporothrix hazakensis]|nr:siderophore-interacting protein [Thermosporothrix hazakensis]GCE51054.1 hypothetical protein KTH_59230 [Thermosporothrix hazakensis]